MADLCSQDHRKAIFVIRAKTVFCFLGSFTLIFVILTLPWLQVSEGYLSLFRGMISLFFSREGGRMEVVCRDHPDQVSRPAFARIEIANRDLLKSDGSGPIRNVDCNATVVGWMPTAMLIALVFASPVSWKRRVEAVLMGVVSLHILILAIIAFAIWRESSEIGLASIPASWQPAMQEWQRIFVT